MNKLAKLSVLGITLASFLGANIAYARSMTAVTGDVKKGAKPQVYSHTHKNSIKHNNR